MALENRTPSNAEPIIRLENVSKRFEFAEEQASSILESLINRVGRSKTQPEHKHAKELWAVNDVSFDIFPGQSMGLIGRNGSGKSTTMKMIARIYRPTQGRITVRGRVSALLELGAGFHTDLTGRENIYLNASVLGLKKQAAHALFDSVVAFSELEKFIDVPVKHYSSGMYMRLGFSVAVHVNPDVLIIDEILAVGDQTFQEKCVQRIYDLKRQGVTIVLVSHNLEMIRKLCTHLVWVENGHLMAAGPTEEVIQQYLEFLYDHEPQQARTQTSHFVRRGSGGIQVTAVHLLDAANNEQQTFKTGDPMTIEMHYTAYRPINEPEFGLAIYHPDGTKINGPNTRLAGIKTGTVTGSGVVRYRIQALPLLPGKYLLTTAIHDSRRAKAYDYLENAFDFRVIPSKATKETDGIILFPATWEWLPEED
ncbi:MAG: ABC transporter ATP-binding protein [Ardenticatenaceae bacterium]|nr:ABC transporter ATP-binding protein [Anaerolineales bacterium]MCB8920749.1 ABC transporter ATP-binding protein [Ardenticatenaceae bacterium]MCB8989708.1 ABC transporter ATP-binding protein [Ardenticatenaceae bacterium]MCB9002833.1 ABC transporter ATP-binding protein [Ardenticatenaceae bacterium]